MSCTPEKREFAYSFSDLREYLRADSLYYSRGFSDEEKVHKNLIYTLDDRVWFDRMVHPAIREVMKHLRRHSPFTDSSGVRDETPKLTSDQKESALELSKYKKLYFIIRDDLVKKEYYEDLRGAILDFLRRYFIHEWFRDKNTNAYPVALQDYKEKEDALLSATLNLKKCHKGKGRRGWW